jgi:hypothetical protein
MLRTGSFHSIVGVIAALVIVLLNGCRAINVGEGYVLDSSKATGVMVVSLTQAGLPSSFNMFMEIRGVGNEYKSQVPVTDAFASSDWKCPFLGTPSEAEPCGRLAIVELAEGVYEFYSWNGSSRVGALTQTMRAQSDFSKQFKITSGKAVYLGNVHFSVETGRAFMGQGRFAMKVRDMRERDLPLLASKNPGMTAEKIVINILPE